MKDQKKLFNTISFILKNYVWMDHCLNQFWQEVLTGKRQHYKQVPAVKFRLYRYRYRLDTDIDIYVAGTQGTCCTTAILHHWNTFPRMMTCSLSFTLLNQDWTLHSEKPTSNRNTHTVLSWMISLFWFCFFFLIYKHPLHIMIFMYDIIHLGLCNSIGFAKQPEKPSSWVTVEKYCSW